LSEDPQAIRNNTVASDPNNLPSRMIFLSKQKGHERMPSLQGW